MLVLLDLNLAAVGEGPPDHIRLVADALDMLGLLNGTPELGEVGELDEVPDVRERGADDCALHHLVGGGDDLAAGSCHFGCCAGLKVLGDSGGSDVGMELKDRRVDTGELEILDQMMCSVF